MKKQYVYYCVEANMICVFPLREVNIVVIGYKGNKSHIISATMIELGTL